MKKKLTVNTLALGNLKQRRKQYTIMIIGIILAMVFSSSIVFFMFSAAETSNEERARERGKQSSIISAEQLGEKEYQQAVDKNLIKDFGFAHTIGYAYADKDEKRLGASVSWLDDKAKELSYQIVNEGTLPTKENEIAAEKSALLRIGYKDVKIGDTITLMLDVQNGEDYLKTVKKEYKLVGILADKKSNIEYRSIDPDDFDTLIPAFYVAENTQTEIGGKEKLTAYIDADFSNYDDEEKFFNYVNSITSEYQNNSTNHSAQIFGSFEDLFSGGDYFFFVILVLVFASCVAIVNAFNTNLKERKKQIGLLRAVGTTRRQIIKIFGREAFIIALICVPVSVALSYAIVRILLSVISDNAIMTKSIWALPFAAVINIVVVMVAALIPLFIASRISPMQAIRNVSNARKVKTKKIKTKMQYDAPSHIAKRNLKFYSSSRIAVSIMLAATIILSCFGFSSISLVKEDIRSMPYDYWLDTANSTGITEADKQNITAMPYFSKVTGKKRIDVALEYPKVDDFFRVINSNAFDSQNDRMPSSTEELADNIKNKPTNRYYNERKADLGIGNEYFDTNMVAVEQEFIEKLNDVAYDGKADLSKLDSGEEIILVAPKKAEILGYIYHNGMGVYSQCDNDVGKKQFRYSSILTAESDYKAGDTITVDIPQLNHNEKNDTYSYSIENSKEFKIGAIISPNDADDLNVGAYNDLCIVTSKKGLESFKKGVNYESLYLYTDLKIDDEKDEEIKKELEVYSQKYDGYIDSNYSYNQFQLRQYYSLLAAMISIIIISFVICASVINNSISARIRENKRVIGTLRAVGADQNDLVKSYIIQMLSMFSWGIGIGFGVYLIGFLISKIIEPYYSSSGTALTFNPWITIAMTILLFVVCSINLWSKVRREMKNSIVENIREL
ncbi:MAG: ABC transporter permease [Eubacterium sp.]